MACGTHAQALRDPGQGHPRLLPQTACIPNSFRVAFPPPLQFFKRPSQCVQPLFNDAPGFCLGAETDLLSCVARSGRLLAGRQQLLAKALR